MKKNLTLPSLGHASLLILLLTISSYAAEAPSRDEIKKTFDSLKFQSGHIVLKGNLATLELPDSLQYLDPTDSVTLLTKIWGNPTPEQTPLGMIFPAQNKDWGVIIDYDEDGYIKDSDADSINYDDLLKSMQEATLKNNATREKDGYDPISLIGWAVPPRYDRSAKTMYWAKELKFGTHPKNALNYNLRVLGRKGVLNLNVVADMDQLSEVQGVTPTLLKVVTFNPGNRYADFNDSTDKVATYGLAALVAGGVAAKLGFFKLLWLGIIAGYKFILIGFAALATQARKIFGRFSAKKKNDLMGSAGASKA